MGGETPFGRDYLLHEKVGSGSWAVVHRATRRAGGPPLAAKVLRPEVAADRRVRELFLGEELALRELDHESIVAVHDLVVEGGRMALLIEFVDGRDLRTHLSAHGGRLPEAQVADIGAQLAGALAYAHTQGVVHLDVKPENVLLTAAGTVKLGDSGVASILREAKPPAGGTAAYAAPELDAGHPPTGAADVWSLGVLLAELVTGARPASHADVAALPPILGGILADCLNLMPRDRPSARRVAAALRAADIPDGRDFVPAAQRTRLRRSGAAPPPPPAASRPHRRRRAVASAAAAAVLAGALAGVAVTASADEPPAPAPTASSAAPSTFTASVAAAPAPVVPSIPTRITYAAHLVEDAGTLYLAVRDGTAIAYLCDGERVEAWFAGTADAGELDLTSKKGDTLSGTYDADAARGSVTVGDDTTEFTLPPAGGRAGLFRSLTRVNGARVKGSWIVLPDGRQVGVVTVDEAAEPAPQLDLTTETAVIGGVAVDTTRIDVESGAGFE
ncbi:hypothetical protein Q0Z83_024210 [Actinoplanes sichuanensis]|uniref:non-specific serine/threonine protein kinase n=1 Tax=Actinoplanes sichuanensis TaxID=512349 RepID=A0ABW4A0M7_9ACTN|nr:serine/threonine-protein kinase [Actinoplanes sichuanensis]BEL04230.1 hypothetical protein Q0Z83_024210 [Actinoplanes sichuanensis]